MNRQPSPYLPGEGDKSLDAILNGPPADTNRIEPKQGRIHALFARWLESRNNAGKSLPYPLYSIARFGIVEGLSRFWTYHLHPRNAYHWAARQCRKYRLIDRREKKGWSRTVYAVDRDGDLFLVECPGCHQTQHLLFNLDLDQPYKERRIKPKVWTDSVPPKTFQCSTCNIGFSVYLEDGIRRVRDHRDGTPPLPSTVVWDDQGTIHLGISASAPWWWKRREICRDLYDGKDAHGHYRYEVFPVKQPDSNLYAECRPETENPRQ